MRLLGIFVLIMLAACGDNGPELTPPTPTPTGLSITPATDLIEIKSAETFAASATLSDGSPRTVQASWGSDNTAVATVDSTGRVSGAGSGQATIFADFSGFRVTRLLRVVPDYQGRWNGDYQVTGCTDDGDWRRADFCKDLGTAQLFRLTMGLSQNRDAVTGTADVLGDLSGPVQGPVRVSGHLLLNGTFTLTVEGIAVEATLSNWETLSTDNDRMSGPFSIVFRASLLRGAANVNCEFRIVAKSSPTPLSAPESGIQSGFRRLLSRVARMR